MDSELYAYIIMGIAVLVALLFLLSAIFMDMSQADIERLCKKKQQKDKKEGSKP